MKYFLKLSLFLSVPVSAIIGPRAVRAPINNTTKAIGTINFPADSRGPARKRCGVTLIDQCTFITAAHCLYKKEWEGKEVKIEMPQLPESPYFVIDKINISPPRLAKSSMTVSELDIGIFTVKEPCPATKPLPLYAGALTDLKTICPSGKFTAYGFMNHHRAKRNSWNYGPLMQGPFESSEAGKISSRVNGETNSTIPNSYSFEFVTKDTAHVGGDSGSALVCESLKGPVIVGVVSASGLVDTTFKTDSRLPYLLVSSQIEWVSETLRTLKEEGNTLIPFEPVKVVR